TRTLLTIHFAFFLARFLPLPRSLLFPYTTLFRSQPAIFFFSRAVRFARGNGCRSHCLPSWWAGFPRTGAVGFVHLLFPAARGKRSEEHTSELQSHLNLVCRLLLEKKNSLPCSDLV